MNSYELIEFEGRQYVNPDISRDEQTDFINTLRDIQAQNNAQIATETHNLGTDIEPTRGGLTGSEEYWKGLYQTPQTEAAVANMKAVAQQTALNNALTNYQNMLQDRYNQAYRNYQKRQYAHSRNLERIYSNGGSNGGGYDQTKGSVSEEYDNLQRVDVEENPVNVPNNTNNNVKLTQQAAANSVNTGGGGIPYGNSGTGYVIQDKNGNPTGIRVYYDGNGNITGAETRMTSMSRDGAIGYINSILSNGGRLYTSAGRELNLALGWKMAMGVH